MTDHTHEMTPKTGEQREIEGLTWDLHAGGSLSLTLDLSEEALAELLALVDDEEEPF